jgi:hypothetical protein
VSRSYRHRAQRAPRSFLYFARKPWLIAYSIAVVGTVIVGVSTAPSAPTALTNPTSLLSEEKAASFALAAGKAAPATPRRDFAVASVAFSPVGQKFGHNWYERLGDPGAGNDAARSGGFKAVETAPAKPATVERARKKAARVAKAVEVPLPEPAPERFAGSVTPLDPNSPVLLAYADPSPTEAGALLDAMAATEPGVADGADEVPPEQEGLLPDNVPLPEARPKYAKPKAEVPVAEKPAEQLAAKPAEPEADKPAKKPGRAIAAKPVIDDSVAEMIPGSSTPRGTETKLAFAKPNDPAGEGKGGVFGGLFGNKPKAGAGVAVYDISAARVYMPDGSVLEAHSGIGKMADNPRYVHVKMNGPTPPHTYVLKMRERRFHGVEAIRMLPIDGKNKHGRDGFLTHSYLLRSRLPESHGCVAFKDYPKFLAAFKAGKVKTLVVVAGGGKKAAVRVAKNGDGV